METIHPLPLTPDQLAAVAAGGGYARCRDPKTQIVYDLIEQTEAPTIDDDYVREKIAEAYADIEKNGTKPLDMNDIKAKLQDHIVARRNEQPDHGQS